MSSSTQRGEPFFFAMSLVLLGAVLVGFAPSFYWRDAARPKLTTPLVVHGVILTAWFALSVVQSALIGLRRTRATIRWHRWLGLSSTAVVVAALWSGVVVSVAFYRRAPGAIVVPPPALLFANLFNLVAFLICFAAGVRRRRDAVRHKRWMTWASVVIIGPATFRVVRDLGLPPWAAALGQMVFVVALIAYDVVRLRRVLRPTWVGLAFVLGQMVGSFTIGTSGTWARVAESLFGAS